MCYSGVVVQAGRLIRWLSEIKKDDGEGTGREETGHKWVVYAWKDNSKKTRY